MTKPLQANILEQKSSLIPITSSETRRSQAPSRGLHSPHGVTRALASERAHLNNRFAGGASPRKSTFLLRAFFSFSLSSSPRRELLLTSLSLSFFHSTLFYGPPAPYSRNFRNFIGAPRIFVLFRRLSPSHAHTHAEDFLLVFLLLSFSSSSSLGSFVDCFRDFVDAGSFKSSWFRSGILQCV